MQRHFRAKGSCVQALAGLLSAAALPRMEAGLQHAAARFLHSILLITSFFNLAFRLPASSTCFPQDMRGHMYPFCRDQHGSRLVQQQLETAAPEDLKGGLLGQAGWVDWSGCKRCHAV